MVEEYAYDGAHNARTGDTNTLRGITGRVFAYDDEDHLESAGEVGFQYDADGFLTYKGRVGNATQFTYGSRGELLRVDLPDGTVVEYVHDPLGRRIAKKIDAAIVEKYLWQGLTRLLAVYDGEDGLKWRFEYANDKDPICFAGGDTDLYMYELNATVNFVDPDELKTMFIVYGRLRI